MRSIWFKQFGWYCCPISFMGYAISLVSIGFMVTILLAEIRDCHSLSDNLNEMFIYTTCTTFGWKWVAEKTSAVSVKKQHPDILFARVNLSKGLLMHFRDELFSSKINQLISTVACWLHSIFIIIGNVEPG